MSPDEIALRERKEQANQPGSTAAVERQHERGKYTARERITKLLDPDSFVELDALVRHHAEGFGLEKNRPYTDGVVTGWGEIDGRKVFVYSQDFTVFGGALGAAHAEKIRKVQDLAASVGAPIIGLNDGGGARIQEGVSALNGYSEIFRRNVSSSGVVPQISVILGPCAGGAVYSPAMTDFVFMVEGTGNMFITGPDVVKTVTGEEVTQEELGGARTHATRSGVAHFVYPDEDECLSAVRKLLSYFPSNSAPQIAAQEPSGQVEGTVPVDSGDVYDMHELLSAVLDADSFLESQADFATNVLCGFGRLDGQVVGVVANQPAILAGCLDIDAVEKAARFVRTCDAFSIPIVTFVDVPGFVPSVDQEFGGLIRHGAKLLYAFCEATAPRIQMIVRKAYGGAYVVMNAKSTGADLCFAWPNVEIAAINAPSAVSVLHHHEIETASDPQARRTELVKEYQERFANPYEAAESGIIDDVIEPADTRRILIESLAMLRTKSTDVPARKHPNLPL